MKTELISLLILFSMIFCHIVDDYYLQGILASMKQKEWWKENYPGKFYKDDYLVALFMHSFSWSFMIMLVPTVYLLLNNIYNIRIIILFIINLIIHAITDNLKANKRKINLVADQYIHVVQIVFTWGIILIMLGM